MNIIDREIKTYLGKQINVEQKFLILQNPTIRNFPITFLKLQKRN